MKSQPAYALFALAIVTLLAGNRRCHAATPAPAPSPAAASDQDLDTAIAAIAAQQKSVKTLTAAGSLKSETLDPKTRKWQPQDERQATATYSGPDAQKCQIACPLSKAATPDGPAPFTTQRYVLVYDGQVSLKITEPPSGLWIAMCEITAGPSPLIDDTARATGLAYSTLASREPPVNPKKQPTPLLDVLRQSRQIPGFLVQKVTQDGRDFLDITAPRPDSVAPNSAVTKQESRFRLDIAKAYALTRIQQFTTDPAGAKHLTSQTDITDFTQPAPGIFYPAHVDVSIYGNTAKNQSQVVSRTSVDVSSAQINTPVPEDTFNIEKVELPVGTSNLRGAHGEVIRFTPDEEPRLFAQVAREVLAQSKRSPP